MTSLTYDSLLMLEDKIDKDETEEWENSLLEDEVTKIKHPVSFKEEIPGEVGEINNVVFNSPKSKISVKAKTIDVSKRGRNKGKGELF